MPVKSEIILSSLNEITNDRITTYRIECPVWAWYDILTHRLLCRNASSTRAIPAKKFRDRVIENPAIPTKLTKFQKGMVANEPVTAGIEIIARHAFNLLFARSLEIHECLELCELSKQDVNLALLPFIHFEAIVTATEWNNFFKLRNHPSAKPELQLLASLMEKQYRSHEPQSIGWGEWHLPLLTDDCKELPIEQQKSISAARCCRVSYYLPDSGALSDAGKDVALCDRLIADKHMSPFEHVATPMPIRSMVGQYVGWMSWRKFMEDESNGDIGDVPILNNRQAIDLMESWQQTIDLMEGKA